MESWLLRHEACPECRKNGKDKTGNNLGVYSDDHSYCFNCGYHINPNRIVSFLSSNNYEERYRSETIFLPEDCSFIYPKRTVQWIEQYELSNNDLLTNGVLWSDKYQRLIFPVYGDDKLLAYQGRYFGTDSNEQKWFGRGNLKNVFHFLGKNESKLVLVEDIVSAIKVGHIMRAMPLFGSFISKERWRRLKELKYTQIFIFLDPDKKKEALQFSRTGRLLGVNATVILAERDPKEIQYQELKLILDKHAYM